MRVLIVDLGSRLNRFGGQARVAAEMYRKLRPRFETYYLGYETEFLGEEKRTIMLGRGMFNLSLRRNKLSEMRIFRIAYNMLVVRRLGGLGMSKKELLRRVGEVRPEVVIANSIQDIVLLQYLKRHNFRFKSIYVDHGSLSTSIGGYFSREGIPLTIGSGINAHSVDSALRKFFNFFDVNVALNSNQLSSMKKFTNKAVCILNGVDIKVRRDMGRINAFKKKYGLDKGNFVILYLGRLFDRQKNVSTLIRAFKGMQGDSLRLLIVGEGPSLEEYRELAGADKRIIIDTKTKGDPVTFVYQVSDLFVLPSHWEGFSLTVIEGAVHHLPLLLSDQACVPDLRKSGVGKISSFDADDADGLRKLMLRYHNDKGMRKRAIAVSQRIAKKFTLRRMLEQYSKLINSISD
ncbi:MAG: glycosyltransferase family 4 protein [Candidatus Micrarchaeota archaeon]|nr:glycosyltransferase family 4 protein [Candidatus Micrarchaeota archaeon]MDE1847433.1 glycosyltransferase family 4 protein [Candidatus Micrarchaeota archaeon]MDE1864072.1 glycosyltransferase family 4 protein [Candidatus Micrarchaeota archaeon]